METRGQLCRHDTNFKISYTHQLQTQLFPSRWFIILNSNSALFSNFLLFTATEDRWVLLFLNVLVNHDPCTISHQILPVYCGVNIVDVSSSARTTECWMCQCVDSLIASFKAADSVDNNSDFACNIGQLHPAPAWEMERLEASYGLMNASSSV